MIFIDSVDRTHLRPNETIRLEIPPQLSASELEELDKLGTTVTSITSSITVVIICMQVCLYFGLKYIWNIMNLIQFMFFMQLWLISLPARARVFLGELKALAFF